MMRLPTVVTALLASRQVADLLPMDYCSPQCPSCKNDVANYDGSTTSCTANSSFITNCGSCQTCVMLYNIQNGETSTSNGIEVALINILNLCQNSPISAEVANYQSQASRVSLWGENLATSTISVTATAPRSTASATWDVLASGNPSWTSVLSTATWAPQYTSYLSAVASAESSLLYESSRQANQTATQTSIPTSTPTGTILTSTSTPVSVPPLSQAWVAGPVMGSVLGMSTVFIVIFLTRRKQRRDAAPIEDPYPKPFHDEPTTPTTRSSSPTRENKPQLHGDCVEIKELESTEIHELPALEPVGNELVTPMEARPRIRLGGESICEDEDMDEEEGWMVQSPLPLSPLPLLFAMSELRDGRMGGGEGARHETYYHP